MPNKKITDHQLHQLYLATQVLPKLENDCYVAHL